MLVNSYGARAIGLYIIQHSIEETLDFVQASQHFRCGKQQITWSHAAAIFPTAPEARHSLQVCGNLFLPGYPYETRHWELLFQRLQHLCRWIHRVGHPLWHFYFKLRAVMSTLFAPGDSRTTRIGASANRFGASANIGASTWACDHRGALVKRQ